MKLDEADMTTTPYQIANRIRQPILTKKIQRGTLRCSPICLGDVPVIKALAKE
jgi:hypothetical protein